jgi:AcrR family transcriptional regulator
VSTTRRRASYHHGDLANALKRVTLELVAHVGIEGFTLREAAKCVGVTHRAAYRHFVDKHALLVALALDGWETLARGIASAIEEAGERTEARLEALVEAYAQFAIASPAHYRIMFGPHLNADGRFPEIDAAIARAIALLRKELVRGMARHELAKRDVVQVGLSLWTAMHGVVHLVLERRIRVRPDLTARYAVTLVTPTLIGLR